MDAHLFKPELIKSEIDDQACEIDVARGRFESALLDLINKGDLSDSDHESNVEGRDRQMTESIDVLENIHNGDYCILPTRPFKKKRRKELEVKDCGFHHTYVMRMFDRSVDLAQFEHSSPLYPICRAWMLNQPQKSEPIKSELNSSFIDESGEDKEDDSLPEPYPWPLDDLREDPRIPIPPDMPPSEQRLDKVNEEVHISPALLLTEHLHRWRSIRNDWRVVGHQADTRYIQTFLLLKAMFDGQC